MGRRVKRPITAKEFEAILRAGKVGRHAVGDNLYLSIKDGGAKSWLFRYAMHGVRRWMGLGAYHPQSNGLVQARSLANDVRAKPISNIDPIAERKQARLAAHVARAIERKTFNVCAAEFIKKNKSKWKNPKHEQQWENTLERYASPVIGSMPIQAIDTPDVLRVLEPIWLTKTETASRVRNRIERVISYATALKYRTGKNPATWRGNLEEILPSPNDIKQVSHYAALPHADLPAFMARLSSMGGFGAELLAFTILTASRTSESTHAEWTEFDFDNALWVVPKERMKGGIEHRVPLSDQALTILERMAQYKFNKYVFPGLREGKSLSTAAMTATLRRLNLGHLTVHGFRSTFSDWVAEETQFSRRAREASLAHKIKNKAEESYQRGDLLDKRRELLQTWADYCLNARLNRDRSAGTR